MSMTQFGAKSRTRMSEPANNTHHASLRLLAFLNSFAVFACNLDGPHKLLNELSVLLCDVLNLRAAHLFVTLAHFGKKLITSSRAGIAPDSAHSHAAFPVNASAPSHATLTSNVRSHVLLHSRISLMPSELTG